MKKGSLLVLIACFLFLSAFQIRAEDSCLKSYYQKSLHFTGQGMRYWYEGENGFMTLTKMPYDQLGCNQCHANSCDRCHKVQLEAGKFGFSAKEAKKSSTCLECHERGKLVIGSMKGEEKDVHLAAGMSCLNCHKEDVHGTGTEKKSIREPGAVSASCEDCHLGEQAKGPKFDPTTRSHKRHKVSTKLHCNACHVRWSITCYNCHFSESMKTKTQEGNFLPTSDLFLLVNYQGKVTAATAMSLIYKDQTYLSYAPYFTHNIMKEGRPCEACHGNAAIKLIKEGKKIPVVSFENGKVQFWKGVVPVVPDLLQWQFLDKKQGKWIPLSQKPTLERFSHYAEPLNEKQLRILKVTVKSKKE